MQERKHDCWKCQYKVEKAGTAHIGCSVLREKRLTDKNVGRIIGIFAALAESPPDGIVVNEYGRSSGWATWPIDFDPVWIEKCIYFENENKG